MLFLGKVVRFSTRISEKEYSVLFHNITTSPASFISYCAMARSEEKDNKGSDFDVLLQAI